MNVRFRLKEQGNHMFFHPLVTKAPPCEGDNSEYLYVYIPPEATNEGNALRLYPEGVIEQYVPLTPTLPTALPESVVILKGA